MKIKVLFDLDVYMCTSSKVDLTWANVIPCTEALHGLTQSTIFCDFISSKMSAGSE